VGEREEEEERERERGTKKKKKTTFWAPQRPLEETEG
jgi:hypothetical protein